MPLRFAEMTINDGFDGSGPTPWQMVPVGGWKLLRLFGRPGCVDLQSDTPNVASVTFGDLGICVEMYIRGLTPGTANIVAKDADGNESRLAVTVKPRRPVRTTFNFVSDNAGHRTTRQPDLDDLIANINSIYIPQANVVFTLQGRRSVCIPQDLGKTIVTQRHSNPNPPAWDHWPDIVQRKHANADFNVFFVWDLQFDDDTRDVDATTDDSGNCLCEDVLGDSLSRTLAHESGHFLGLDDDTKNQNWLMYFSDERTGVKIPRIQADFINPDRFPVAGR
jgi:hypothetical protein